MGEPLDHRPAGWIRQSRKCCAQAIHNHMVVDFRFMSSATFAIHWQNTNILRTIHFPRNLGA